MPEARPPALGPAGAGSAVRVQNGRRSSPAFAAGLAVLVAAAIGAFSCAHQPPVGAASEVVIALSNAVVAPAPVLVVPDHRWSPTECPRWSFQGVAGLWVFVLEPEGLPQGLVLQLEAAADAPLEHLRVRLDETAVEPEPHPQDSKVRVRLESQMLSSGLHLLSLETPMDPAEGSQIDYRRSCIRRIAYRFDERPVELEASDAERLGLIAEHLAKGVSGLSHRRLSGFLFVGPGHRTQPLDGRDQRLHFVLENASAGAATYTASVDGELHSWELEAGGRRSIELKIGRGSRSLRLEVAGGEMGLFLWGAPHVAENRSRRTPVILITLDTTRRDALSLYHPEGASAPNLERLAQHATIYERAYASSPWTLPSHASIFTGLHPSGHGAGVLSDHLLNKHTTLAELFQRAGYLTAGFAGGELCSSMWGLGQGFQLYSDPRAFEERGDFLADRVLDLLDRHRERNLFLFVNLFDPHALYTAPEPFPSRQGVDELLTRVEHPDVRALANHDFDAWLRIVVGDSRPGAVDLPYLRAAYLAEVAYADHHLGRILDRLRERGLYEEALIVVTADHGESLGEDGLFSHGVRLGAEVLEIPLLVKLPRQAAGSRSAALVSHVDLFALIAAVARGEPAVDVTELAQERRTVLSEEHESIIHPFFPSLKLATHLYAVQSATRRTVVWPGGSRCQQGDVGSWSDVACSTAWETLLQGAQQVAGATPPGTEDAAAMTAEQRERLQSLGYLQ